MIARAGSLSAGFTALLFRIDFNLKLATHDIARASDRRALA
jgi:hypothetical protein